MFFYMNLSAMCCGLIAVIFGVIQMLRKKQGTYFNIAVLAIGTLTLGFLFCHLFAICGGSSSGFSLGYLAMIGSFLFFLTSNRSYISVLEDAPTKHKKRASIIAAVFPAVLVAVFAFTLLKKGFVLDIIPPFGLCVAAGLCSYFSFRQVLIPDIKRGFIDCMRPYNTMVCLLALCCTSMELLYVYDVPDWAYFVLCAISDAVLLSLALFLYRGVKKWRT